MSSKVAASRVASLKPKKKCCRKDLRCITCPLVVMRMQKLEKTGASGKELKKGLAKARAA